MIKPLLKPLKYTLMLRKNNKLYLENVTPYAQGAPTCSCTSHTYSVCFSERFCNYIKSENDPMMKMKFVCKLKTLPVFQMDHI